jgi:hexosaminidase
MKELNLSSTKQLQAHFSNEIAKHILNTTNKKVIMWHDGVYEDSDPRIIMQYWDYKMDEERIKFINEGRKTIYSPCSQFYFNDPYGELPLSTTYKRGIHLTGLSRKAYKNILGMESCIWTEWIDNTKMLEFNTTPRLFAFSEACWTNATNKDFTSLIERMEKAKDFYEFYNLTKASKKIYLAHGNEYRANISKTYRGTEKEVELKMNNK